MFALFALLVSSASAQAPFQYVEIENAYFGFGPEIGLLHPSVGEEGHWSSSRFTYPEQMWVTSLQFPITAVDPDSGYDCNYEHHIPVEVYVSSSTTPPANATPVMHTAYRMPRTPPTDTIYEVDLQLNSAIHVPAGSHLFVNVKYGSQLSDEGVCLLINESNNEPIDVDWWSNTPSKPYNWTTLESFGIQGNTAMRIRGIALN